MDFNYRSMADLNSAILKNLHRFPHDIDLVVGIPRSGMLPANLIALYLNKQYTDIDSFIDGRVYRHGKRNIDNTASRVERILLVDDSLSLGTSIQIALKRIKALDKQTDCKTAVVFASPEGRDLVDIYCEIVPMPRFFQWNVFHHPIIVPYSFFDLDGVLCENPPIDDDGPLYFDYISNAVPKFIPTYEIDTIVTCRLEKYRTQTAEWLRKHDVKYKRLIMLALNTREERIRWGRHGEFKGTLYKESNAMLFIESSYQEAKEIVRVSHKPVFCTESFSLLTWEKEAPYFQVLGHKIRVLLWRAKMHLLSCRKNKD